MSPTPGKAQWEESSHRKCGKEQNHSEQKLGRRKRETRLKKKHSLQIWYHAKKQNEQYHYEEDLVEQPYNVPTTTEPERRRPKKEPEKKHPAKKNQPLQVLKRREPSKRKARWTKAENKTEETPRTDERGKPSPNGHRTTKQRTYSWARLWHRQVMSLCSRLFFVWWITADPSPWGNFTPMMKQ